MKDRVSKGMTSKLADELCSAYERAKAGGVPKGQRYYEETFLSVLRTIAADGNRTHYWFAVLDETTEYALSALLRDGARVHKDPEKTYAVCFDRGCGLPLLKAEDTATELTDYEVSRLTSKLIFRTEDLHTPGARFCVADLMTEAGPGRIAPSAARVFELMGEYYNNRECVWVLKDDRIELVGRTAQTDDQNRRI
jgi:hypothetical protein